MTLSSRVLCSVYLGLTVSIAGCGDGATQPPPSQNPILLTTVLPSGHTMFAGDSLTISVAASDSTSAGTIPLAYTYVAVNGAFLYTDSVDAHGAFSVQRTVKLRIPDGPLPSHNLSISTGVVPTIGATIADNLFIITVIDTVNSRRVGFGAPSGGF